MQKNFKIKQKLLPGNNVDEKRHHIRHWKIIAFYLTLFDIFAVNFAYFFELWLRFDLKFSNIPQEYFSAFLKFAPFYTLISLIVFYLLRLYNSLWRFASFNELNRIFVASIITAIVHIVGITLCIRRMPISYYIIGAVMQFILITGIRFSYRYITLERRKRENSVKSQKNVMVIGAGAAGQIILKELRTSGKLNAKPCCVIDDNPNKWNRFIEGVPIVGGRNSILKAVQKYQIDQILFAIPTASPQTIRDILNICKETHCELKRLPGVYQLAKGEVSVSKMKPVAVEDLLGRDPIKVDLQEIFQYLRGKTILVTGGGGSIGSELCRQIAEHEPKRLIIFDIYENNAYEIEQDLKRKFKNLDLIVLIGSVRDSRRIDKVFKKYRPDIVYHAAAHKHVPLMETSPNEAIKNNVLGTYKTAYAALKYKTKRFVLISTDKAVNPTNIMGASKRLCEMIIQSMDAVSKEGRIDLLPLLYAHEVGEKDRSIDHYDTMDDTHKISTKMKIESVKNQDRTGTQFVAVRFGNVLGSNGSVIPLFKKLQAGVYAWGGEIFVLDMGEPVKIDTLARNLIKLSGFEPGVDIPISYIGLRKGEKLYEEKLMDEEGLKKTENKLIHIAKPILFDTENFLKDLDVLAKACYENSENIIDLVRKIVPTFHPEEVDAKNKKEKSENIKR